MKATTIVDTLLEADLDPKAFLDQMNAASSIRDLFSKLVGLGFHITTPWSPPGDEEGTDDGTEPEQSRERIAVLSEIGWDLGRSILISVEPADERSVDILLRDIEGRPHRFSYSFRVPGDPVIQFINELRDALMSAEDIHDLKNRLSNWNNYVL